MNIIFKKCISENNRLSKSFSGTSQNYAFDFKGESSVYNPVVLISTGENLTQYNYAEISDFNRKYFIDDITVVRAGLYEISMHVDVLSTYENQLRGVQCVAKRNSNNFNLYLKDPDFQILSYEDVEIKKFSGTGFTKDMQFVLAVSG